MGTYEISPLLRYEDLKKLIKVSRSSLDRWEKKNLFPKRVQIGANSVGWRADQVKQWIEECAKAI